MSAHAVGNSPKPVLGLVQTGVLVDLADAARVGAGSRGPQKRADVGAHAKSLPGLLQDCGPVEPAWRTFNAFCSVVMLTPPGPEFLTSMLVVRRFSWSAK